MLSKTPLSLLALSLGLVAPACVGLDGEDLPVEEIESPALTGASDDSPQDIESQDVWPGAATPAATTDAVCHGTQECDGNPISNWRMLYCGDDYCTNQGCGKPDINPGRVRRQPREQARDWETPGGGRCTEYRPYADFLTCTC